jgi:hypothetical protein
MAFVKQENISTYFPTVFGQIWAKNFLKFPQIGDFCRIVKSLGVESLRTFAE